MSFWSNFFSLRVLSDGSYNHKRQLLAAKSTSLLKCFDRKCWNFDVQTMLFANLQDLIAISKSTDVGILYRLLTLSWLLPSCQSPPPRSHTFFLTSPPSSYVSYPPRILITSSYYSNLYAFSSHHPYLSTLKLQPSPCCLSIFFLRSSRPGSKDQSLIRNRLGLGKEPRRSYWTQAWQSATVPCAEPDPNPTPPVDEQV